MVRLAGLDAGLRAEIERELTIPNPKIEALKRFSGWVPSTTPKFLYGFANAGDDLLIAPGFAWRAWKMVEQAGYLPELTTDMFAFDERPIGLAYTGEIREYQDRVISQVVAVRQACIIMPTGSGKTDTIIRLICHRNVPAVILVHTIELMDQWVARFQARTGYAPATYGGKRGKKKAQLTGDEAVIVAMVQSVRRSPEIIQLLARSRPLVVQEEAHHTPATTFTDILAQLHPRYRYGITATPTRQDGMTQFMFWWIGPIRAQVSRKELADGGFILNPDLRIYQTDFKHQFNRDETGQYDGMLKMLSADGGRLQQLVAWISDEARRNPERRHLVRCNMTQYAEEITAALRGAGGLDAELLTGDLKKTTRDKRVEIVERLKAGTLQVVVCTSVADEGLDAPNLTDLWIVTPLKDPGKVVQVIGRICRAAEGKPVPRVHDVVDPHVISYGVDKRTGEHSEARTLYNQFRTRYSQVYRDVCVGGHDAANSVISMWRRK